MTAHILSGYRLSWKTYSFHTFRRQQLNENTFTQISIIRSQFLILYCPYNALEGCSFVMKRAILLSNFGLPSMWRYVKRNFHLQRRNQPRLFGNLSGVLGVSDRFSSSCPCCPFLSK